MEVAIIGGGAAGFFSAIAVKENYPDARVVIFEKSKNLLSKVKISGGGRCNLTNACETIKKLVEAYPRGGKTLKKVFRIFNNKHTIEWFESRGVPLIIQDDNCVFPESQSSKSIVECFFDQTKKLNIRIELNMDLKSIKRDGEKLVLNFKDDKKKSRSFDKVIVATGGSPKRKDLECYEKLGHKIEDPVPSLFTFNMPTESITEMMGIVVEKTFVKIIGTKFKSEGALLVTHWGMSGPVILQLSSFGAVLLKEKKYDFSIQVNWVNVQNHDAVSDTLNRIVNEYPNKFLSNYRPYQLPERLWLYLLEKVGLDDKKKWNELGKKGLNKLINILTSDVYLVRGKTTFRDEFVTCGGVSLKSIDIETMQSRVCENLYFAGELLDIDGITGGYNLQAAWTTAFIAAKLQ
ncbi:NAD(P)/FAD-dependent oxidoreductase [bacterium]|nr:NAD(P)/FAD-dependent oxidoreductase [bacterium]